MNKCLAKYSKRINTMSRFICPITLEEEDKGIEEYRVRCDKSHRRLFNHTLDEIYLYRYIPTCFVGEKMMEDLFVLECDRVKLTVGEINQLLPILKSNIDNINYYLSQLVRGDETMHVSTLRRRSGLEYLLETFRFTLSREQFDKLSAHDDILVKFKNKCINYYKRNSHMDKVVRYIKPNENIPYSHFWWISPEIMGPPKKKTVSFVSFEPTEVRYYVKYL